MTNVGVARRQAGLTQWDLARALGVSESKICRIETGRAALPPNQRAQVAALLEAEDRILFDDDGRARAATVKFSAPDPD